MRTHALPILLLLALTCFAHAPGLTGSFTSWDDLQTVANNPLLGNFKALWTQPQGHIYIPLTYTVWHIVSLISHTPFAFKLASLATHATTTILLFFLLRVLLEKITPRQAPTFLGALLFAVHPLQVESVAWISGLKDLLAGLFAAATLLALVRNRLALAFLFFTLALFSKPAAVWLLPAAGVYCFFFNRPALKWIPVAAIPALATAIIARKVQPPVQDLTPVDFLTHVLVPFDAIRFYVASLLFPFGLCIDPGRSPQWLAAQDNLFSGAAIGAVIVAVILAISIESICSIKKRNAPHALLGTGLLLFLCALLPNCGLLPFDFQTYSTVSDHYAYPAFIGLAISAAVLLSWSTATQRNIFAAVLLLFTIRAFTQSQTWRSTETLFTHAARVNPNSLAAHNNLASFYLDQDQPGKASPHILQAKEIIATRKPVPSLHALVLYNDARLHAARGNLDLATDTLSQSLALDADLPEAHFELGRLLQKQNQLDEAEREYLRTAELQPAFPGINANLSALYLSRGNYAQAERYARTELSLAPNSPTAGGNLAAALLAQNKQDEAAGVATKHPTSPAAQNVLGILAARAGNFTQAESHLRQATEKDPTSAPYLYNLANILTAQNKTEEAQPLYQKALSLGYEPARSKLIP